MRSRLSNPELLNLLYSEDPSLRAQGIRKMDQEHLGDLSVIVAVLERCFDDDYVVMEAQPTEHFTMQFKVVGDGEDFVFDEGLPASGDPIYALTFLRLEDLELPGTAGTLRVFDDLVQERPFWPSDLASIAGAVRWEDDEAAMRVLAPPMVRRGCGDRLLPNRSAQGIRVLCEVAWDAPRSVSFLEALLQDDVSRELLLDVLAERLRGGDFEADVGVLQWIHRCGVRGSRVRAGALFRSLVSEIPVAVGFSALTNPEDAGALEEWLSRASMGDQSDIQTLAHELESMTSVPEAFPLVALVERLPGHQACALIRNLGAEKDPRTHPTLRTHLLAWMLGNADASLGWEAWGLQLLGGGHAGQDHVVHQGMSKLERGTVADLPPSLGRTVRDILEAQPPIRDALPRIFGIALRYPTRVGEFVGPIQAALAAGVDGDLRGFLRHYLDRCAKAPMVQRMGRAGTYLVHEGYRPDALRPFFEDVDETDPVYLAWRSTLPKIIRN